MMYFKLKNLKLEIQNNLSTGIQHLKFNIQNKHYNFWLWAIMFMYWLSYRGICNFAA